MIKATIIQDSTNAFGNRLTTFELEYPRFIHAEFMTHRMFSRNAASSRAIPIETMLKNIQDNPAIPIHWGKNQVGMQAKAELEGIELESAKQLWDAAREDAIRFSRALANTGLHKQIANRRTEADQIIKVVVSATEYDNFFWLRNHEDAQPEIHELAIQMQNALDNSVPEMLFNGEWHVPYVTREFVNDGDDLIYKVDGDIISLEQAKKVSASCCAQVSYRKSDTSLEKAESIFNRLITADRMHASPIEHQATPILTNVSDGPDYWEPGITHMTRDGLLCSGNFTGWIQYRHILEFYK